MTGTRGRLWRHLAVTRLHRSGRAPQRVLLVGDGAVVAEPTEPGGARLADLVADAVAARTGRGLDLDVVFDLAPALQAVGAATRAWRLWRYEAVVVVLEEPQLQEPGRGRPGRIPRLAHRVIPELAEASGVLLVRLRQPTGPDGPFPRIGDGSSTVASMAIVLGQGCDESVRRDHVGGIADRVARMLGRADARAGRGDGETAPERRALPEPERDRQRAVDRTHEALGGITPDLERVVLLARNTFEVPFVQVNLLDHGRIRTLAFVGAPGDSAEQPLCTITVGGTGPTIIADTWDDHRLDANPHVHDALYPVRFYAAHPIESLDGYRIGTLCVFDFVPHERDEIDETVLRDLALLAEAEISALQAD
ncbi:hypothetical protein [uncultured Amnibacterium sp.]|uniref:hypothetical protein n=1 Tax=uncultured Amnibacterium sp. TaxID=1631851 RepID=UPI0035CC9D74